MSLLHFSTSIRSSSGRCTQRHTSAANSIEVRPTCFDLYKAIITKNYTKAHKYSQFYQSSFNTFRLAQVHPQGELHKSIQVQPILSKFVPHVSTCIRPSSGRITQSHTNKANSIEVRSTCFDLHKSILRENYTKVYKYSQFYRRYA
jgi:hypothetical protein